MNNFSLAYEIKDKSFSREIYEEKVLVVSRDTKLVDSDIVSCIHTFKETDLIKRSDSQELLNKINARLLYLESVLEDDQDVELFSESKKTLNKFFNSIKHIKLPLIGADNAGYLVCEWRNEFSFKMVQIRFYSDSRLNVTCISDDFCKQTSGLMSKCISDFLITVK